MQSESKNWKDAKKVFGYVQDYIKLAQREIIVRDGTILDIGCNDGKVLKIFSDQYPKARLYGVDFDQEAVRRANQLIPDAIIERSSFVKIPFQDNLIDIAFASAIFDFSVMS